MPRVAEQPRIFLEDHRMNPIQRQHERTSFPELRGAVCSGFKAVADEQCKFYSLFFIRFTEIWHRFYLDAGLLFWEEGTGPDPENDLLDGEHYADIGEQLCAIGVPITDIEMADSRLTMQ